MALLISLRSWHLLREGKRTTNFRSRCWRILIIVIESGMINAIALICQTTLYFLGTNAFYVVYDPISQLTTITPTIILVLTGLELTTSDITRRHRHRTETITRFTLTSGSSVHGSLSRGAKPHVGHGLDVIPIHLGMTIGVSERSVVMEESDVGFLTVDLDSAMGGEVDSGYGSDVTVKGRGMEGE